MSDAPQNLLDHAQVIEALADAGIPKSFRSQSETLLNDGRVGQILHAWITGHDLPAELSMGRGRLLYGSSPNLSRLFYMLCRGILLRGYGVQTYTLPRFIEELTRKGEDVMAEEWDKKIRVLAIKGFFNGHYKHPFSDYQLYRTEAFLREQLDEGRSMILEATSPELSWWSPFFRAQILSKVTEIPVV